LLISTYYNAIAAECKRDNGLKVRTLGCQIKTNAAKNRGILPLLSKLAGDEPATRHTLLNDYPLLAKILERLGFHYSKGQVIVLPIGADR